MDITIKTLHKFVCTNLIVLGLAACSSSPAPWTQADDSPWGSKRASEAQNTPSDAAVADTSLNDPVLLADPAPEPILMQEPEVVTPEVIIAVVEEEKTPEQEIMALSASHYAVQVYAGATRDSVEKFQSRHDLDALKIIKTDRSGSVIYVLVDVYPDRATANTAAVKIEAKAGTKPWVRSIASLQAIITE